MVPPLPASRRTDHRSLSLSAGGEETGENKNELGFGETRRAASILLSRDSCSTVDRRWMVQIDLGRFLAKVGNEICGLGLRCLMGFCARAGSDRIGPLGRLRFKIFF
jgi:hypothetical protein